MVAVVAGSYSVGCEAADESCWDDEKPIHPVDVPSFAIMRHEVTVAAYAQCVEDGVCRQAGDSKGCSWPQREDRAQHPINCVSWQNAHTYCEYRGWRLPTETEWEVAARGPELPRFPWGTEPPTCELAVVGGEGEGCSPGGTLAVSSRPTDSSWVSALDMGGNLREWTSSDYAAYPGGQAEQGRKGKVNRGGSWRMKADNLNASHTRGVDHPKERRADIGFRCAMDR
jgi:formylglycine-generating enzyme required for sulfatase activity